MPRTLRIPRIIHQSWKTADIPSNIYLPTWVESWKTFQPDWEYRLWTDQDNETLVRDFYPEFYEAYAALHPPIKKADFCRFLYMHRYGGVYVDLDFACLRNVEPLLAGYDIVLGRLSPDACWGVLPNAFMASVAGHEFWWLCARDAARAPASEQMVEMHTGPFRLQWAYNVYKPANTAIYPHRYIYPIDWHHLAKVKYRSEVARLAQSIRTKSPAEMAQALPGSFMVTFWTKNW